MISAPPNLESASSQPIGRQGAPRASANTAPYVVLTGNPNCGKDHVVQRAHRLARQSGQLRRRHRRAQRRPFAGRAPRFRNQGARPARAPTASARNHSTNRFRAMFCCIACRNFPPPALVVVVVDASNLQRNLYYATQVIELGLSHAHRAEHDRCGGKQRPSTSMPRTCRRTLGVPVLPLVASSGQGVPRIAPKNPRRFAWQMQPAQCRPDNFANCRTALHGEIEALADCSPKPFMNDAPQATAEALLILSNEKALASSLEHYPATIAAGRGSRASTAGSGRDRLAQRAHRSPLRPRRRHSARVVTETHAAPGNFQRQTRPRPDAQVWGMLIFVGIMALMFQSIFTFARIPMDAMQAAVDWFGGAVGTLIPPGDLNSLLVGRRHCRRRRGGRFSAANSACCFCSSACSRTPATWRARRFLMDRLMSKVGLHGKSFIPMLSSFACAIPGIMATRTIESPKDRLVTILVAPLMSCSARLPVYTLLIAACIPDRACSAFSSCRARPCSRCICSASSSRC